MENSETYLAMPLHFPEHPIPVQLDLRPFRPAGLVAVDLQTRLCLHHLSALDMKLEGRTHLEHVLDQVGQGKFR
jgi:hypothetical protein